MDEIEIKAESLPERCEICHQSDYFNPSSNYCLRCIDIKEYKTKGDNPIKKPKFIDRPFFNIFIWPLGGLAVAMAFVISIVFIGLFISYFSPPLETKSVCTDGSDFAFYLISGFVSAILLIGALLGTFIGIIFKISKSLHTFSKKH